MKLVFFGLAVIMVMSSAFSTEIKYPNGLLTSDYGIVTDNDLAYDALRREILPYDPHTALASLYWQCFPIKEVIAKYDPWHGHDGMGAWNKIYTMCSPEIYVHHGGELQIYVDRRGHRVDYCRDFVREWQRLTKDQNIVCLNGEGGAYHQNEKNGQYKLWTWEKFKTNKGCYSYFYGTCNTGGYSKRKCCRANLRSGPKNDF